MTSGMALGGGNSGGGGGDYHKAPLPTHGSIKSQQQLPAHSGQDENNVTINPLLKPRLYWDVVLSMLFFYNATVIPLYMAYSIGESIYDPIFWINRIIDLCFFGDILLCFETGIYAGELIIMNRREVRQLYLRTWFPLDLISTIPYDLIAFLIIYPNSPSETFQGHDSTTPLSELSVIEIMKLVRLLKFFKTINTFNVFEKALVFRYEDMAKINFTLFVCFCLHWSACIFSWLDENLCEQESDYSIFVASGLSDLGNGAKYLASFYWALATMVTIGYGDISARCSATRLFSLIIMLVASAVYAYGLSYVMDVIRKNRKQQAEFRELMDMANKYMDFRKIPSDLREELRKFLNFKSESEARRNDLLSERLILNELSPELRFAVLRHVNSGLLDKVPFFQEIGEVTKDNDTLQSVVLHLQSQVFRPNEVIIKEGDVSDELFFITKGTCMLVKWGTITTKVLPEGSCYGETGFLAKTEVFRGSTRFSTPFMKNYVTDSIGTEQSPGTSLKRQVTEKSLHNNSFTSKQINVGNESGSISEEEYLQSHTFLTQTYADLRYITRATFNTILSTLPKIKLDKVYRIMARRYEAAAAAIAAEEKELKEKYPEAYEDYIFDDDMSFSSEEDWRKQENDILDEELNHGPDAVPSGLLRRVLSRNLSQGSVKTSGPTFKSPRVKMVSPLPPHVKATRAHHFTTSESPRKASAPAVLSPSQQDDLLSMTTNSSKPQRTTLAVVEELDEQKRPSPRHSSFNPNHFDHHPPPNVEHARHSRITPRHTSTEHGEEFKPRRVSPRNAPEHEGTRPTRISKRTSLSSLAETGFVAPPTPTTMRYHNVIPARASLYYRQKSKHHSRDDIDPSSPDLSDYHLPYSHRPSRHSMAKRRTLLSKRSQDIELKTFSQSDAEPHDEIHMKQLVNDIDGLMTQLTSIKRRLSHTGQPPLSPQQPHETRAFHSPERGEAFSALSEEDNLPTTTSVIEADHDHDLDIDVEVPILASLPSMKSMKSMISAPSSRHLDKELSNLSIDGYVAECNSSSSSHDVLSLTHMPPKSSFPKGESTTEKRSSTDL